MLIQNAVLFLGGAFAGGDLRVCDGVIDAIGALSPLPDEEVIDLGGRKLLPGFVDIHTHGHSRADAMLGLDAVLHMSRALVRHGVTSFLPTTMAAPAEDVRKALCNIALARGVAPTNGAQVLGANMEGPFLSPAYKGAHPEECLLAPSVEAYLSMAGDAGDAVRLTTIDIEPDGAPDLIAYLAGQNVAVSCGHSGATAERFHKAEALGLTHVTHLYNAMGAFSHRAPGVIGAALAGDAYVELVADLIHVHPDVLAFTARAKPGRMCLITDSMMATGLPEGTYRLGQSQQVIVKDGAARIPQGNLAGSVLTMDQAVRNMIGRVGVEPERVIPMATSIPADSIGQTDRGRIAEGLPADLVCVDDGYNVRMTMVKGVIAYES